MFRRKFFPALIVLFIFTGLPAARAADLHQELARLLATPCLEEGTVGLRVVDISSGRVLFDHQGDRLLTPASNVKLITAAAALSTLGPSYTFPTEVFADHLPASGTLVGNLYLKGHGDPALVTEELWLMARELKYLGISRIDGDLVADDSLMARDQVVRWNAGERSRAYAAGPDALSLNFNTVTVRIDAAPRPGKRPRIQIDPESSELTLDNRATTGSPTSRNSLTLEVIPVGAREILRARGSVPQETTGLRVYRSIRHPALYTARVYARLLREVGISLRGRVRRGVVPPGARLLYTHHSKPLALIVRDMDKWSNNFIAEQLLRTMGGQVYGEPGTREKGLQVEKDFLSGIGIRPGEYRLEDGSGLSERNRLSAAQLVAVLTAAYRDFSLQAEFLSSLGFPGVDGVVVRRFADFPAPGRLRIKTGSLEGVRALSGYAARKGEILAFSFLFNGSSCSSRTMERIELRLAAILAGTTRDR